MTEFRGRRHGAVYVVLAPPFAALLANLTRQLVELLRDGEASTSEDPLEAMVGMEWAPIEIGLAHYGALDRLQLTSNQQYEIGVEVGGRINQSMLGTAFRLAGEPR